MSTISQPSVAMASTRCNVRPHMCSRTRAAGGMNAVHELFFVRQDKLIVEFAADQRGGGVAHADDVRPGLICAMANFNATLR